jgi:hypothetical protein
VKEYNIETGTEIAELRNSSISEFAELALSSIVASLTNRTQFSAPKLQELADSIRASGVHQPILVRLLPGARAGRSRTQTMPKFWRAKVTADQIKECQTLHWELIASFVTGEATVTTLWDWIETGFTYRQMMSYLIEDGTDFTPEAIGAMNDQITAYDAVIERFRRTGRAGFSGQELLIARAAACVMDSLVELDRHGIAERAARWSIEQMRSLRTTGRCAQEPKTKKAKR